MDKIDLAIAKFIEQVMSTEIVMDQILDELDAFIDGLGFEKQEAYNSLEEVFLEDKELHCNVLSDKEKETAFRCWYFAYGMAQMDGVKPSDEALELARKEILGEISTDDIKEIIKKKYSE